MSHVFVKMAVMAASLNIQTTSFSIMTFNTIPVYGKIQEQNNWVVIFDVWWSWNNQTWIATVYWTFMLNITQNLLYIQIDGVANSKQIWAIMLKIKSKLFGQPWRLLAIYARIISAFNCIGLTAKIEKTAHKSDVMGYKKLDWHLTCKF